MKTSDEYVAVKEYSNLVRDNKSNGIININKDGYKHRQIEKNKHREIINLKQRVLDLEKRISILEQQLLK